MRKYDIPEKLQMDGDIIDDIAVHSLKYFYNCIIEDMDNFVLHQKGHPDDYDKNIKLKEAFSLVLEFYGH